MRVLLTGADGQLGKSIIENKPPNHDLIITTKNDFDLSNGELCFQKVFSYNPDWIINCGAFTKVDKAEEEEELTFSINSDSVRYLSKALIETKGRLLQISTDYVFDGTKNTPYTPYDPRNPQNIYGKSKAKAEKIIEDTLNSSGQGLIIRTSWLMGPSGDNFALKILSLLEEREKILVVSDQIGCPTTTFSLAKVCWKAIEKYHLGQNNHFPEILHWSEAGVASWYDVANAIKEIGLEMGILKNPAQIVPIRSESYKSNSIRPKFSLLDSKETHNLLEIPYIHWKKQLYEIFKNLS